MKIVSQKLLRVATLGGSAVIFYPGVPKAIADEIGLLAIQMGAQEYNEIKIEERKAEVAVFDKIEGVVTQKSSVLIDDELVTFLEKMMDEGDPNNFKADGYPKAAAVNKALGRTVDTDAREVAWESILNS
jgi:hypothetical protein